MRVATSASIPLADTAIHTASFYRSRNNRDAVYTILEKVVRRVSGVALLCWIRIWKRLVSYCSPLGGSRLVSQSGPLFSAKSSIDAVDNGQGKARPGEGKIGALKGRKGTR